MKTGLSALQKGLNEVNGDKSMNIYKKASLSVLIVSVTRVLIALWTGARTSDLENNYFKVRGKRLNDGFMDLVIQVKK